MAGQGAPQTWCRSTESSLSRGPELGSWKVEEIPVSDEGDFVIYSCSDGKPVKCGVRGGCVHVFCF